MRWLRCDIKSLNLLGNVLAKEYAVKYNASEAIQHRGETVTEGASSNVYAIKDGKIQLLEVNEIKSGGVYIQATRGVAPREHSFPTPEVKPVLMAFAKSYDRPYEDLKNGINAVTVEDIRWLRCDIKSLNLLGNVLAKEYAVKYNAS
ncbi:aminotransferase class IV, partial [Staphylococcus aureus]|uniref:aminotransferase class IV n=1 Tax=Staphylococcus aureus TaxID=1280 RepID=UPI002181EF5D